MTVRLNRKSMRKSANKCKESNGGMSLIEVIVSILILGIIVTPLLMSFISGAKLNLLASEKQKASEIAASLMDELGQKGLEKFSKEYNWQFELDEKKEIKLPKNSKKYFVRLSASKEEYNGFEKDEETYMLPNFATLKNKSTVAITPFLHSGSNYDEIAIKEISELFTSKKSQDIKKATKRNLEITISEKKEGFETKNSVSAKLIYSAYGKTVSYDVYSKTEISKLNQIYIFHKALLNTKNSFEKDEITVKKEFIKAMKNLDVFIVPQLFGSESLKAVDVKLYPSNMAKVHYLNDQKNNEYLLEGKRLAHYNVAGIATINERPKNKGEFDFLYNVKIAVFDSKGKKKLVEFEQEVKK